MFKIPKIIALILLTFLKKQSYSASGYCRPRMCYTGIFSWPTLLFTRHLVEALLSLVKCLYFAIIVSFVLITGVVAAVGTYPRLVLRDS